MGGGTRVSISGTSTFEIGKTMNFGESVKVEWGATDANGAEFNGTVSYKKVDPNATITVYVKGTDGINLYAWGKNSDGANVEPNGAWPGKTLSETVSVAEDDWYYFTFDDMESVNLIFNKNGNQTDDISGISEDTFFEYTGGSTATKLDISVSPVPAVRFSPNGGDFYETITVTATVKNAVSAWYAIGTGAKVNISGTSATFSLGENIAVGDNVTVNWGATGTDGNVQTGSVTFHKIEKPEEPEGFVVYYDNSVTSWNPVKIHYWGGEEASTWPGKDMTPVRDNVYYFVLPEGTTGVVFNNGNGIQSVDVTPTSNHLYRATSTTSKVDITDCGLWMTTAIETVEADTNAPAEYYNMQGMRVDNPSRGFYIKRTGNKIQKIYIH